MKNISELEERLILHVRPGLINNHAREMEYWNKAGGRVSLLLYLETFINITVLQ